MEWLLVRVLSITCMMVCAVVYILDEETVGYYLGSREMLYWYTSILFGIANANLFYVKRYRFKFMEDPEDGVK